MESKYLSDGRKVVIVGQLNQTETIVQEVFVNEAGDELPGGERFIAKSLHDEPVESWASRKMREHEVAKSRLEAELSRLNARIDESKSRLKSFDLLTRHFKSLEEKIPGADLSQAILLMSGEVEYTVLSESTDYPKVTTLIEAIQIRDCHDEGIKLITMMGRSDGNVFFRVNRYSDGSGPDYPIVFFKDKASADAHCSKLCNELALTHYNPKHFLVHCAANKIQLSEEAMATIGKRIQEQESSNQLRHLTEIARIQKVMDEESNRAGNELNSYREAMKAAGQLPV